MSDPRRRRRRAWLAAAAATVLLPLPLLAPALTGERVFVPFDHRVFAPANLQWSAAELAAFQQASNFDPTETTLVCREEALFAQQELARGRFPAWNPYARAGAPLFASTLNGFAHPPFVLHLLLDPQRAFVWTAWLQCALAGLTMLGLLRELRAPPLPALLGAVVFAAGGPMLARLHLFMHYGGWMWLPALLWALHRLARGGGAGAAAALALATALTWTAGFPPAALVTSLVAGAAWVLLVLRAERRRARVAAFGAGGFALGLGLAAVQILPMLAFFPESQRDLQRDATVLREQGLDRAHWLGFVLESPFSTPQQNREGGVPHDKAPLLWLLTDRAGETGAQVRLKSTEHRAYLGALPLLLVVLGAAHWRRRGARFALVAAVALLLLAHGDALLLVLATLVPQVRALQPMEFLGPLPCLAGMLAAFGLQRALRRSPRRARIAAAAAGALLAALCALGAALLATAAAGTVEGWFLAGMRARWGEAYLQAGDGAVRAAFGPVLPAATALCAPTSATPPSASPPPRWSSGGWAARRAARPRSGSRSPPPSCWSWRRRSCGTTRRSRPPTRPCTPSCASVATRSRAKAGSWWLASAPPTPPPAAPGPSRPGRCRRTR